MLLFFFFFFWAIEASSGEYTLQITRYAFQADEHYLPTLLPTCDYPRQLKYANLPVCGCNDYCVLTYNDSIQQLWWFVLDFPNIPCKPLSPWTKYIEKKFIPQDICNDEYYDGWTKMHVFNSTQKPQQEQGEFGDWRKGPDVGLNITLQTFHWTMCQHDGPVIQAQMGTCYPRPYFGSYAFVGFKNDTVLVGYVWEGNKNCQGELNSWMYVVKQQCSQPTYSWADGPSSWIGWW